MANPSRGVRQVLANHIEVRNLTYQQVADVLGCKRTRVSSLIQGLTYPTAAEIEALEKLFGGMPIETMFDANMLKYHKVVEQ